MLKAGERWGVLTNTTGSSNLGGVGSAFAAARLAPEAEIFAGGTYRAQERLQGRRRQRRSEYRTIGCGPGTVKGTFRPAARAPDQARLHRLRRDTTTPASRFHPARRRPRRRSTPPSTRNEIATTRWTYSRPDDRLFDFDANVYWTRTATDQRTKIAGTGRIGCVSGSQPRRSAQLHHQHQRLRRQQHDALRHRAVAPRSELRRRQLPRRGRHRPGSAPSSRRPASEPSPAASLS